jgi:hypothetical protein
MACGRRYLGHLVLVLAVMAAAFVGAKLGLLGTREVAASHNFADVPSNAFYHTFVEYLGQSGVTAGCGPGLFCPEQAVTRGQMAVFLAQLRLLAGCPPDSVRVASTCVDKYEASIWQTANAGLIQRIRLGTATLADLTAAGAVQRGALADDYDGAGCPDSGNGCTNLYAVSVPGVTPSGFLTWTQATAAARNAGKRLPTNAEWQAAALGTPSAAPCVVVSPSVGPTGTAGCVSDSGAFDMVGNLYEWVADWVALSTACVPALFGADDLNCLAGASAGAGPGALLRGGFFGGVSPANAGVFVVEGRNPPTFSDEVVGFRGAR